MFITIFKALGGFKGVAIILLVAAALGYVGYQHHQISVAKKELTEAVSARDAANEARDKAIAVAKANDETIKQLAQEKKDAESALNELAARNRLDAATIAAMSAAIKAQAANPANQVQLSPVLKQIISDIQAERAKRQGVKP